jgi:catechol 2,3-dioxygenase-like lactoylglutathione lyase family enzyme
MTLNHLNLTVTNAAETARFLEQYFGMRPLEGAPPHSATMAFLTDDRGMILSMFRGNRDVPVEYPGFFHIGFGQPSHEAVNQINRRLKEDGYDVPEPSWQHGSWTFYFTAPGGFRIEVLC